MNRAWPVLAVLAFLGPVGCIKPPDIVMVDRGTALEHQASGSFDDVEHRLDREAVEPRPVPLTPEQLEELGAQPTAPIDDARLTDSDRVDAWLVQHCIGEGADGLLVDTRDACRGAADPDQVGGAVERVNRARRQLWLWMHAQRADVSVDDLRRGWRKVHAAGVVCGGWIQGDDGKWQGKTC
ncbi:MAG TPA: DUF1318 domain-containing protein [Gaiellaceae bacterium]|nr:DUF1318 domain-containing protein [Gaiellaceae bacterium]